MAIGQLAFLIGGIFLFVSVTFGRWGWFRSWHRPSRCVAAAAGLSLTVIGPRYINLPQDEFLYQLLLNFIGLALILSVVFGGVAIWERAKKREVKAPMTDKNLPTMEKNSNDKDSIKAPPALSIDLPYWEQALDEYENKTYPRGLWAQCFAEANGEEAQAKAIFLRKRAEQLQKSNESHNDKYDTGSTNETQNQETTAQVVSEYLENNERSIKTTDKLDPDSESPHETQNDDLQERERKRTEALLAFRVFVGVGIFFIVMYFAVV